MPISDYYKHPTHKDGHDSKCKECQKQYQKDHRALQLQNPTWAQEDKEKRKEYRVSNNERFNYLLRRWRKNVKEEVLAAYCNGHVQCARCKFSDPRALTIDHIHGGGTRHRKEIGNHLHEWLRANDYPPGFQVLCMNCQFIKEHEKKEGK